VPATPSTAELKWQREALRLRGELAEARRAWRSGDSRAMMQRDKELRRLGLDARALEDGISKSDLVSTLIEVCRALQLGDLAQIAAEAVRLQKMAKLAPEKESFVRSVCEALQGLDRHASEDQPQPLGLEEALQRLHKLCAASLKDEAPQAGAADVEASEPQESALRQQAELWAEAWRTLVEDLRMPSNATPSDCASRVRELRAEAVVLKGLLQQLRCQTSHDLPQRVTSLLQLCDERLASQRIVEALQKLLRVEGIAEVLPALKDVLDIGALRRRAAASAAVTAAAAHTSEGLRSDKTLGPAVAAEAGA